MKSRLRFISAMYEVETCIALAFDSIKAIMTRLWQSTNQNNGKQ
jgi:hypothetical protein